jgi:hypothetical protein
MHHPLIHVVQIGGQLHMEICVEHAGRATADIIEDFSADLPLEQHVTQEFNQGLRSQAAQHSARQ